MSGTNDDVRAHLKNSAEPNADNCSGLSAAAALPQRSGTAGQGLVILLAEDNEIARKTVRAVLERDGFTVLVATNGTQALEAASKHTGGIDLLLTDFHMPDFNGDELARRLLVERPDLKVLVMSGLQTELPPDLPSRCRLIPKPFRPDVLLRRVAEVISDTAC